jgi:hypothetical protein
MLILEDKIGQGWELLTAILSKEVKASLLALDRLSSRFWPIIERPD